MKKIEISPEWILNNLVTLYKPDGMGNITIVGETISDCRWIDLALVTIGNPYVTEKYITDSKFSELNPSSRYWTMKIDDLMAECPKLYARLKGMEKSYSSLNINK